MWQKHLQKFTVLCMKFVIIRQQTTVQFHVGLLVFAMTQGQKIETLTDKQSAKLMADFLSENCRVMCKEIHILLRFHQRKYLKFRQFAEKKCLYLMGPLVLTAGQTQKSLDIATLPKERFNIEGQVFLYQIIAINEERVRNLEPKLKFSVNEQRSPSSIQPCNFSSYSDFTLKKNMEEHQLCLMDTLLLCPQSKTMSIAGEVLT